MQITFASGHQPTQTRSNIHEVVIPGCKNLWAQLPNMFSSSSFAMTANFMTSWHTHCVRTLGSNEMQGVLKEEYDIVVLSIMLTECYLPFIHKSQVSTRCTLLFCAEVALYYYYYYYCHCCYPE